MQIQNRINDPKSIDFDLIDDEIRSGKHVIVQFSDKSYDQKKLSRLNSLCNKYDENFSIRFYGHYSSSFDFKTLVNIPNVKSLYIDCLLKAENVNVLAELQNLSRLSLGVFELKETEILGFNNLENLSELIVTETRTKALNLEHLGNFKNLKFLIVGGHTKNIDAIGSASNLEYLSLNSIKKANVPFVNRLNKLKTLRFILGGREDLTEIEENQIENLEIVWVRGFKNISNIGKFKKLKSLS